MKKGTQKEIIWKILKYIQPYSLWVFFSLLTAAVSVCPYPLCAGAYRAGGRPDPGAGDRWIFLRFSGFSGGSASL